MADPLHPPLHGVRVLELAHLIAGPICGMYLADQALHQGALFVSALLVASL